MNFGSKETGQGGDTEPPLPITLPPRSRHFVGLTGWAQVRDGFIAGFDAGEFGGGLWWFSRTGARRTQLKPIQRSTDADGKPAWEPNNVIFLKALEEDVLAFEGLSHDGYDNGRAVLVRKTGRQWSAQTIAKFETAPFASIDDGSGSWIVLCQRGAFLMQPNGDTKRLAVFDLLDVWPHTAVRTSNGMIYIGMRHYVGRLVPVGERYQLELLRPTERPSVRTREQAPGETTR